MQITRWPPYVAARRRLAADQRAELEREEADWTTGLVLAEFEQGVREYVEHAGELGWIELEQFRVLAKLAVDAKGRPEHLHLFDLKQR